ncbi:MAG: hypothetical protein FWF81_00300 [Defluviitaleaceae bacterium]|nr:hypothetical protein [Defluviitaleaceae bacterium]
MIYNEINNRDNTPDPTSNFDNMEYTELRKRFREAEEFEEGLSFEREDIHDVLERCGKDFKILLADIKTFERSNDCAMCQDEIRHMKTVLDQAITTILCGIR